MYDSANKRLIWKGVVSKTIDPGAKPDKRQKNSTNSIEKLLKNYPPKAKLLFPVGKKKYRGAWYTGPFFLQHRVLETPPQIHPNLP